jgi:hypothetical protein
MVIQERKVDMIRTTQFLTGALLFLFLSTVSGWCQAADELPGTSLGLDVGYFFPFGNWVNHRFANDADQFQGGFVFRGDLNFKVGRKFALAITGGYMNLDETDWEEYAGKMGDQITTSSSAAYLGLLLKPHLMISQPDIIILEVGAGVFFLNGQETFEGMTYDYDFLKGTRIGIIGGLEYERFLSESFALSIRATCMIVLSGIHYADGLEHTITALPITAGFRVIL